MKQITFKSITKIVTSLLLFAFIIGTVFHLDPLQVKAAAKSDIYIDDQADLFTSTEEDDLTSKMKKLQNKYETDMVILTMDGRNGLSAKQVIDDYVDAHCDDGTLSEDVVISLRDVSDRWIEIRSYGKAETYITNSRVDTILDDMTPELKADNYYDAYLTYLDDVNTYLGKHPNPLTWLWVQLLIGLGLGAIITFVMVFNTRGKITTNSHTYLDQQHSGLVAKRDMYVTTTVKRTHIPKSSGSSGGRSSGGRSSSGGGRSI